MAAKKLKKRKKKTKKVLSPEEKALLRRKNKLHADVKALFKAMGFEYISTNGIEKKFGDTPGELDGVYIFENIIILCEETISLDNDHLRTKQVYYQKILENKQEFFEWLKKLGKDKFKEYPLPRYSLSYIYITETIVDEDIRNRFPQFKYIAPKALKYFLRVAKSIRFSSRNEFFKFLGLNLDDIGSVSSSHEERHIDSAVIIPESSSGFPEGIQVVSFVMKAKELLDCAYVFRKDNWENRIGQYYQRLVDKNKVERIRNYLAKEGRTFIDNIIVTLPEGTSFSKNNKIIDVNQIATISNVQIRIPYKINSIGIIDGQHRVLGHYEGNDHLENKIAQHRDKRHLFVTGIFYEEGKFDELKKRTFESELFLLMNNNHSKVRTDLLHYIETLKAPLSPIGVAGTVLMRLNEREPFLNLFKLSPLDKEGIKTPTIVKFGLQGVVEISEKKETLFKYWKGANKKKLLTGELDQKIYDAYVDFCVHSLAMYFSSIKANFKDNWNLDKNNRLLATTAIVVFLKSFSISLQKYQDVKDFEFYKEKFSNLTIDFSKGEFAKFGSRDWKTLTDKIDAECWT